MKTKYISFALLLQVIFTGCSLSDDDYDFEYDIFVTDTPANLHGLNTHYDDYNSDLPYLGQRSDIVFSSNRGNSENFDIVSGLLDFSYHEKDDIFNVSIPTNATSHIFPYSFYQIINTSGNEFGPYSYLKDDDNLFMFASEVNGQYKIKFVNITRWDYSDQQFSEPMTLPTLNDNGDNLYPSRSSNANELIFCSNREDTVFNLWSAIYTSDISGSALTEGNIEKIEKIEVLSSDYDDKCPLFKDNLLVFASNRPGGFGGYDLWYARYMNDSWTRPINLGEKINTAYDEFRPVHFEVIGYELMIFSSNRPDGKGGFDLYIVKSAI